MPQVGDRFNPWRLFHGVHVPEAICRYARLSPGAKLTYGRLQRYLSEDRDFCWPKHEHLATELGCSVAQVRRYLDELADRRDPFIKIYQRGLNKSNLYAFIWHQCLEGPPRPPQQQPTEEVQDTPESLEQSRMRRMNRKQKAKDPENQQDMDFRTDENSIPDRSPMSIPDRSRMSEPDRSRMSEQERSRMSEQERSRMSEQDRSTVSEQERSPMSDQGRSRMSEQDRSSGEFSTARQVNGINKLPRGKGSRIRVNEIEPYRKPPVVPLGKGDNPGAAAHEHTAETEEAEQPPAANGTRAAIVTEHRTRARRKRPTKEEREAALAAAIEEIE